MDRGLTNSAVSRVPAVSVVLPVYNGGAELRGCLESLAVQALAAEDFEVVAVDDGSTDGSAELLDRFAAAHPNVRVVHQPGSGGAGRPRNVATALARGEFVFYLDADDALVPDALERMLAFANEHGSDIVVVGRITLEDGRVVSPLDDMRVVADARLRDAFVSLTPHKLIRRELIAARDLRFREDRVAFEDGIFLAGLVPHARRISVLNDRAYYVKQRRPERLSLAFRVPEKARSMVEIADTLRRAGADPEEIAAISFHLYRRLLRMWNTKRFLRLAPGEQDAFVAALHAATALVPASRDAELLFPFQLRSLACRTGRARVVAALIEFERDNRRLAALRRPPLFGILLRALVGKARLKSARALNRRASGQVAVRWRARPSTKASPLSKELSVNAIHAPSARGHRPDRRHAGVAGRDPREG